MPRTTVKNQNMFSSPRCSTLKARVAIRLPTMTRAEVKTMPAFLENPSVMKPSSMMPKIWPTINEFEILVLSAVPYFEPYKWANITLTLVAICC